MILHMLPKSNCYTALGMLESNVGPTSPQPFTAGKFYPWYIECVNMTNMLCKLYSLDIEDIKKLRLAPISHFKWQKVTASLVWCWNVKDRSYDVRMWKKEGMMLECERKKGNVGSSFEKDYRIPEYRNIFFVFIWK